MDSRRFHAIFFFILMLACRSASATEEGDTTTVTIDGTINEAPECTLNNNRPIDVDFGDGIIISEIDGVSYKRTKVVYSFTCTSASSIALKLAITGSDPGFGTGLIKTDKDGLGIRLYSNNKQLPAGEYLPFTYSGAASAPEIDAVLTADDAIPLTTGGFNGFGVMLIDYE